MLPVAITAYTATSAIGYGCAPTLASLREGNSGLRKNDFTGCGLDTWIGRVDAVEDVALPDALSSYTCRNNQLALMALEQDDFMTSLTQMRNRYGPSRVAVIVGTSTSGIGETELAYAQHSERGEFPAGYSYSATHATYSLAEFLCTLLELSGPSMVISTACSSSAKVFATAERYLRADLCDAVLVGGVDSLCLTTLYGFNALQLVSRRQCRPFDHSRDGISIGEAAGFAVLQRQSDVESDIALIGYGESSDAYHMSSPHPEGDGAVSAMTAALTAAAKSAEDIGYVNCHGTATPANDLAEDKAVFRVFGDQVPCSSTKGWTGHTLGAAGILEAVISALCLEHGFVPGTLNTENLDTELQSDLLVRGFSRQLETVLSNSFGFGGTNCSLLFGRGYA